jgi:murein DD-endopeptidase MepM/ murein hydrolase activator NlpD
MDSGTVLWADWGTNLPGDESDWGYRQRWYLYKGFPGIVTVIQHPGWIGIYAHLSDNDAAPRGAVVKKGQLIGHSGNTGGVDAHLHREALVDLSYRTGGGLIYGRTDPTIFDGGIAAQGSIQEDDFLMALTDEEQKRLLAAADRINGVIDDPKAKVLTTNHLGAIADAVLDDKTPLPGGGETSARTKDRYQKQEFDANQNLIKDLAGKVEALTAAVAALAPKES